MVYALDSLDLVLAKVKFLQIFKVAYVFNHFDLIFLKAELL